MENNKKTIIIFLGILLLLGAWDILLLTMAISHSKNRQNLNVLKPDGLFMRNRELLGGDFNKFLRIAELTDNLQTRKARMLKNRREIAVVQILLTGAVLYYVVRGGSQKKQKTSQT